ncbi:MAG: DUF1579 family protein [Caldilineaceae bacterium]
MSTSLLLEAPSPTKVVQWQPTPALCAGPEMAALTPFHSNCVWQGTVAANGMGPGSPAMTAVGKGTFAPLMDGAWLAGDFEQDQFLDGKVIITWKAHYVVGWDPRAQEYKITYVDNNGSATLMRGHLAENAFIVETLPDAPIQLRLTWTLAGPGQVHWRNECAVNGGSWFLVEEYLCTNV